MHVFIDTNILLSFFHFSKEDLDALHNVFASHKDGSAKVNLTQQVCDEFRRNREVKIKDALKRFKDARISPLLPSFMKAYPEYDKIMSCAEELQKLLKAISDKADQDIEKQTLLADALIKDIMGSYKIIPTTAERFGRARVRSDLGNPPGKNNSLGDALNWETALEVVPPGEDLHVISEDGDYFSPLREDAPHPFLEQEWFEKKGSKLRTYRKLAVFMSEHFDGVAFSYDKDKEALVDVLFETGSFAGTHAVIAKLEKYSYFSLKEVGRILDAAHENDQFGWIVADYDVSDFLARVAVPRQGALTKAEHQAVIATVIDEQNARKTLQSG